MAFMLTREFLFGMRIRLCINGADNVAAPMIITAAAVRVRQFVFLRLPKIISLSFKGWWMVSANWLGCGLARPDILSARVAALAA